MDDLAGSTIRLNVLLLHNSKLHIYCKFSSCLALFLAPDFFLYCYLPFSMSSSLTTMFSLFPVFFSFSTFNLCSYVVIYPSLPGPGPSLSQACEYWWICSWTHYPCWEMFSFSASLSSSSLVSSVCSCGPVYWETAVSWMRTWQCECSGNDSLIPFQLCKASVLPHFFLSMLLS